MSTIVRLGLCLLLLPRQTPSLQVQDLIQKLSSEKAADREEAETKLKAMGTAASPDLLEASRSGDLEKASRAKRLLRILELRDSLPTSVLHVFPKVEDRLASDPHEWTLLFLRAAGDWKSEPPRKIPTALSRMDLDFLAARALRGAQTPDDVRAVSETIEHFTLRSAVPALQELLRSSHSEYRLFACSTLAGLSCAEIAPDLIPLLRDPDVSTHAAGSLIRLRAWRTYPAIVSLLSDKDPLTRRSAIWVISQLRLRDGIPELSKLLKDPDAEIRRSSLEALDHMGDRSNLSGMIDLLQDPNPRVRVFAAAAIGHGDEPKAIARILDLLGNPDRDLREPAIEAAGNLGLRSAVPTLVKLIEKDTETSEERSAALALGKIGDPSCVPRLRTLLHHSSRRTRGLALEALALMEAREALPDILDLLRDPNQLPAWKALESIARLGGKAEAGVIAEQLKNPIPLVRETGLNLLQQLRAMDFAEAVLPLLKDPERAVRYEALRAVATLKPKGAFEGLLGCMDLELPASLADRLAALGASENVTRIRSLLKDSSPETRACMARLLGLLKDKESTASLFALLSNDPDPSVKSSAAWTLGSFQAKGWFQATAKLADSPETDYWAIEPLGWGGREALPILNRVMGHLDPEFRRNGVLKVMSSLAKAGGKEAIPYLLRLLDDVDDNVGHQACMLMVQLDAKGTLPEILRVLDRRGQNMDVSISAELADQGLAELLALILRHSAESHPIARARIIEYAAKVGAPSLLPLFREALKAESPVVAGAAAQALARMGDRDSLSALRSLLAHPDESARHGAASALSWLGEPEGARILIEEQASSCFALNRLRSPSVWGKLSMIPLAEHVYEGFDDLLRSISELTGLPIELEHVDWNHTDGGLDWSYRDGRATVLDALEHFRRSRDIVLEANRIRVLRHGHTRQFWKDWLESAGKK